TTHTSTLSLHDALPISGQADPLRDSAPLWLEFVREGQRLHGRIRIAGPQPGVFDWPALVFDHGDLRPLRIERRSIEVAPGRRSRSEEHTSELQSRGHLV